MKALSDSSLKKHIETVHEGIKPFKCKTCDYETAHKPHLKKHVESVHEGFKPFKCTICEYRAGHKSALKTHTKSVHELMKKSKNSSATYVIKNLHENGL